ncbi:MAG TPA: tRNA (adenosine(37)-N6)-threonylcarbamoyltransferase complex dimerization subunit type 1 TsaB [bacterium]|nr:tRNA (adenosine(37)-N6)-threonylcarbamoyltransferase complex dimerization subunit type 1 TsaB [bacterium]
MQLIDLALETTGHLLSLALGAGGNITLSVRKNRKAEDLPSILAEALRARRRKVRDIGRVFTDAGPGYFTGIRAGLVFSKTLCQFLGCKLFALNSLDILAEKAGMRRRTVAVVKDALGERLFFGLYRHGKKIVSPRLIHIEELKGYLSLSGYEPFYLTGDAVLKYGALLGKLLGERAIFVSGRKNLLSAGDVLRYGRLYAQKNPPDSWKTALPVYLKPSYAEERKGIRV